MGKWDGRKVGKKNRSNYPKNFEFVHIRPNRLWTQIGLALETWRNPVDVLFVPAHTLPILRRRKILNSKLEYRNTKQYLNSNYQNSKRLEHSDFENLNLFRISDFVLRILSFLRQKTKYVVTIHDLGVEYLPGYHSFPGRYYLDLASKYAAREADALIAVSKATRADLIKRYRVDAKKIFVVSEGVDIGFFKPQSKLKVESVKSKYKIGENYVLAVGTVQPRKNLESLIRAFARVSGMVGKWDGRRKMRPTILQSYNPTDLKLVIAGKLGWDYQKIVDLPKKLGIADRVKFLRYVDARDMPALYTGASVFAACSLFEGFDLPILEALACGCGVVASDIGPHKEIFRKVAGPVSSFPPAPSMNSEQAVLRVYPERSRRAVGNPSRT
ncbi:glycosyltransferase family 4 protein, partial [Candidatus Gottesmanbacteria bacterium]|nr:glycosyltransferase family 4 protein [Candidatus Gottesmanbacteria bacterium]